MPRNSNKYQQQLSRVFDELAESVWLLNDEEIKEEAKVLGIDAIAEGERLRERLLFQCKAFMHQKLNDARAKYEKKCADLSSAGIFFPVRAQLKAHIWNLISVQPQFQSITAKFRNFEGVADEDFAGMLRQLIQLKLIDPKILDQE